MEAHTEILDPLRSTALAAALLAALACGGAPDAGTSAARVDTLDNGRIQVSNLPPGSWTDRDRWTLSEDLRIGSEGEDSPERFGAITALLEDHRGRIYVLDGMAQEIRVFNPDGTFSHHVGHAGKGPGEFRGAMGMTLGPGDSLWVIDPLGNRYSLFDDSGRFVASWDRSLLGSVSYWQGHFQPDGSFLDWGLGFPDERPGVVAGRRIVMKPRLRSHGFESVDSLPPLEFEQNMTNIADRSVPVPFFQIDVTVASDPGGDIWFARTDEYRIYRRTTAGDTVLEITLPARRPAVTEHDRAHVRKVLAGRPGLAAAYLRVLPKERPILQRLITDAQGNLFVIPDLAGHVPGSVVDVFTRDGIYLGRLDLPHPLALQMPPGPAIYVNDKHLLVALADSVGAPYVSRLRIVKP